LAGGGHVLFTTLLGVAIVWFGMKVDRLTGSVFPLIAAAVLIGFGLFYLLGLHLHHPHKHFADGGHDHDHAQQDHHHGHGPVHVHKPVSDRAAIGSLLALLTFSPCEGFLPIYVSAVRLSWSGFLISSAVLAGATLASMVLFTYITMSGLKRFKFQVIERYENIILGTVLCLLGIAVLFVEG
jgi:nickel/cobalt exporter